MTNHHDNLDNLSRIVTDATTTSNITSTSNTSSFNNSCNSTTYNISTTKFTTNSSSLTTTSCSSVIADMKCFSKLKHLKRSLDASLSPVDVGHACPKCPKKLGSKEAFELHLMVHETAVAAVENNREQQGGVHNNQEQHSSDGLMLPLRQKGLDRGLISVSTASSIYEVPLSGMLIEVI